MAKDELTVPAGKAAMPGAAGADKCCASCGKAGDGLKRCTACKSVWYCGVQCQIDHRKAHKKECKRIKKDLEASHQTPAAAVGASAALNLSNTDRQGDASPAPPDEEDTTEPKKECPVCLVPLPLDGRHASYWSCCGQTVCCGCDAETERALCITNRKRKDKKLPPIQDSCAFCRVPIYEIDSERLERMEAMIGKGDPRAMFNLALDYLAEKHGLARDEAKAVELLQRAADLGCSEALTSLGNFFLKGDLGFIQDVEKAVACWEDAAKKGDVVAQLNLGQIAADYQEHNLAIKHFKLAAAAGCEISMKRLLKYFSSDKLTKAELEEMLRAHHAARDEMASEERQRFIAYEEAMEGNDDTMKEIYFFYYEGLMTAKELKVTLKAHGGGDIVKLFTILSKCRRALH